MQARSVAKSRPKRWVSSSPPTIPGRRFRPAPARRNARPAISPRDRSRPKSPTNTATCSTARCTCMCPAAPRAALIPASADLRVVGGETGVGLVVGRNGAGRTARLCRERQREARAGRRRGAGRGGTARRRDDSASHSKNWAFPRWRKPSDRAKNDGLRLYPRRQRDLRTVLRDHSRGGRPPAILGGRGRCRGAHDPCLRRGRGSATLCFL